MTAATHAERLTSYSAFFPFYLSEHRHPISRRLHFFGTSLWLICLAAAVATLNPWLVLLGMFFGYGPAWVGHFFFERNRPATFRYPVWSAIADHHMVWLALTGRLGERMAASERLFGHEPVGKDAD